MSDAADVIHLDLPASLKYLNVLGAAITAVLARVEGLTDAKGTAYNVELAVQETSANIVTHAYQGQPGGRIAVTLRVEDGPRRLVVELRDSGKAFDREAIPLPDLENGQIHGYGLFLVESLMDEVQYQPQPGHNQWRLVKNL
jgi:anti-sigma regulatory factor (Ser/Thr protein kinase)